MQTLYFCRHPDEKTGRKLKPETTVDPISLGQHCLKVSEPLATPYMGVCLCYDLLCGEEAIVFGSVAGLRA